MFWEQQITFEDAATTKSHLSGPCGGWGRPWDKRLPPQVGTTMSGLVKCSAADSGDPYCVAPGAQSPQPLFPVISPLAGSPAQLSHTVSGCVRKGVLSHTAQERPPWAPLQKKH